MNKISKEAIVSASWCPYDLTSNFVKRGKSFFQNTEARSLPISLFLVLLVGNNIIRP
jgi:hypothetical protein